MRRIGLTEASRLGIQMEGDVLPLERAPAFA
jgi:hypothetical protein